MIRRRLFHRHRAAVNCREVGRVLQGYLDGQVEDDFAHKIESHLDKCRDCGLEAETYRRIKASLASRVPEVDTEAIARLRTFGEQLTAGDDG